VTTTWATRIRWSCDDDVGDEDKIDSHFANPPVAAVAEAHAESRVLAPEVSARS